MQSRQIHVRIDSHVVVYEPVDDRRQAWLPAFPDLELYRVAGPDSQRLRQHGRQGEPFRGKFHDRGGGVQNSIQTAPRGLPRHCHVPPAVTVHQPDGDTAKGFQIKDTGQACDLVPRPRRGGFDEADHQVVALGAVELKLGEIEDGILRKGTQDQEGRCRSDPHHRDERP